MDRKKMTIFAVLTAICVTAAVVAAVLLMQLGGNNVEIELPPAQATPSGEPVSPSQDSGIIPVQVNADTVQSVIATLSRPDSYYRTVQVETFWDESSAIWDINTWVKADAIRISVSGVTPKNVIVTKDNLYIWYSDNSVYTGSRDKSESLLQTADAFDMLLTYEDVLALDKSSIVSAEYRDHNGAYCIYVTAADDESGYVTDYVISVETGLLVYAETTNGSSVVYRMTALEAILSAPPDSQFTLPNGITAS